MGYSGRAACRQEMPGVEAAGWPGQERGRARGGSAGLREHGQGGTRPGKWRGRLVDGAGGWGACLAVSWKHSWTGGLVAGSPDDFL